MLRIGRGAHALLIGPGPVGRGEGHLLAAAKALPLLRLQQSARGPLPRGQLVSVAPLRAGAYRIVVSPAMPPESAVSVSVGRGGPVITRTGESLERERDGHRAFVVELPVAVNALVVSADRAPADVTAWVEPLRLDPGPDAFTRGRAATAVRYGDVIAYFVTDRQFPEPSGAWIRPDGPAVVVVQTETPRDRLSLRLRNGPVENAVTVRTAAGSEQVPLAPGEERAFPLPLSERRATAVTLAVARWFRPSDVNPGSDDVRRLGAWVEFGP